MSDRIYAAIDLEMTGLQPGLDEIIEVGIVRCTPDRVLDRWQTLVRPLEMPPLRVQHMTRIAVSALADAPSWAEIEPKVRELLDDAILLGHNIPFDERFLEAAGYHPSHPSADTLELARIIDPAAPSHRLSRLCDRYGIALQDPHRALSDAEAARQVFLQLRDRCKALPLSARDDLSQILASAGLLWPTGRILRDWLEEAPRLAGLPAPSRRPSEPPLAPMPLPSGSLAELTERAFRSAAGDGLEQREQQLAMARDVAETLQRGDTLIVEAGTGTGKSLAYLLPASLWALKTGNTVLVSTHTINLQQQLEGNDVELVRRLVVGVSASAAESLRATVLTGRGNYLCQERLDQEMADAAAWENPALLARVAVWRYLSERGDRAELRLRNHEARSWPKLSAERTRCFSDPDCVYAVEGSCFLQRAQSQAASSHIVVVNHALLCRALVSGSALVPEAPVVIVDEAHALEDAATDQLSLEMTEAWMKETVTEVLAGFDALAEGAEQVRLPPASEIRQAAARGEAALADLFAELAAFVSKHAPRSGGNQSRGNQMQVTLSRGSRSFNDWSDLELRWEQLQAEWSALALEIERIASVRRAQDNDADAGSPAPRSVASEAQMLLLELRAQMSSLGTVVTEHSDEVVAWATRESRRAKTASLHTAPLSVAQQLQPLWNERHASILTGATLATSTEPGGEFRYLRERLGIDDAAESQHGSPFDYERRCRIYLPVDALEPNNREYDAYVASAITSLAVAAGGRSMVLFRSHAAMQKVGKLLRRDLDQAGLALVQQGRDGSAARVIEALREDPRTVAFGVAALWTGVDVPGEALSLLIITRLPFDPPNDPVRRARADQYDNDFEDYALPSAILKFRQGLGRLIRSQSDIGAVVILDGRMMGKRYGRRFRQAMPPAPVIEQSVTEIAADLRRFLPPISPVP